MIEDLDTDVIVRVRRDENGVWNGMDVQGNWITYNTRYLVIDYYYEGFARVQRHDKLWNIIDRQGKILSPNMWFKAVGKFFNGLGRVQCKDGLWNFIDKKGNILSSQWFKNCYAFYRGFAVVQREDELWNLIDINGIILCKSMWFGWVGAFTSNGSTRVMDTSGKWGVMDTNGRIVVKMMFDNLLHTINGNYAGIIDKNRYLIDKNYRIHRLLL